MSSLFEKGREALIRFSVEATDKVLVAVSGGPDSVCLLHLLKNLPSPFSLSLHVAHLNHLFRAEAGKEADFVRQLAKDWDIPATLAERPVQEFCRENGFSKQAGARMVRYQFLYEVAESVGAKWIAIGHTADDQAETFLMRILRGAGMLGLSGIPEKRGEGIIRPLIDVTRDEIMALLLENKIPSIEDPSNRKLAYLRNRIRHQLLPELKQYNPRIKETLIRESTLFQAEDNFMQQAMLEKLPELGVEIKNESVTFDINIFLAQHVALQRRLLRWGIEQCLNSLEGIGFQHIEMMRAQMAQGKSGNAYHLPHGLRVKKQYKRLIIQKAKVETPKTALAGGRTESFLPEITTLPSSLTANFPEWALSLKMTLSQKYRGTLSACIASFDFDKISQPLSIRGWKAGDYFMPSGMKGHRKKLQDFFVDAKITREDRKALPLLFTGKDILWVIGHRIDERFRATDQTSRTLTFEIQ